MLQLKQKSGQLWEQSLESIRLTCALAGLGFKIRKARVKRLQLLHGHDLPPAVTLEAC